jgi:hypothetical protein
MRLYKKYRPGRICRFGTGGQKSRGFSYG